MHFGVENLYNFFLLWRSLAGLWGSLAGFWGSLAGWWGSLSGLRGGLLWSLVWSLEPFFLHRKESEVCTNKTSQNKTKQTEQVKPTRPTPQNLTQNCDQSDKTDRAWGRAVIAKRPSMDCLERIRPYLCLNVAAVRCGCNQFQCLSKAPSARGLLGTQALVELFADIPPNARDYRRGCHRDIPIRNDPSS